MVCFPHAMSTLPTIITRTINKTKASLNFSHVPSLNIYNPFGLRTDAITQGQSLKVVSFITATHEGHFSHVRCSNVNVSVQNNETQFIKIIKHERGCKAFPIVTCRRLWVFITNSALKATAIILGTKEESIHQANQTGTASICIQKKNK